MQRQNKSKFSNEIKIVIAMFIAALAVGGIIIFLSGESVVVAYKALWQGAFVGNYNLGGTLSKATPLIVGALGATVAVRAGIVNLGLQGQFLMGAFAAALVGFKFSGLPPILHITLAILAACLGGMLWAWPASIMKTRFNVDEVISTIMLNYIALLFTNYLINYPFKDTGTLARTPAIAKTAQLQTLIRGTTLNTGIYLALALVLVVYILLWKTKIGYDLRLTGLNPTAARYAGLNITKYSNLAFLLSGALAGIGGAIPVLGIYRRFVDGIDIGYGLEGLTVSLLANNNPFGVVVISVLFGAMRSGSMVMERTTTISREIVDILQAVLIFFVASNVAFKNLAYRFSRRDR